MTQPDPANSNLVGLLLKDSQMARAAEGFNRGTAEMASAFGTAQQQASKKAALGGGGGAASPLGDIGDIMKIQQDVTDQNEHARFMANMGVLAKVLFPGDPDGIAKATEVANNKGLLGQFGGTAAGNATSTSDVKNFNAARAAAADDVRREHPDWTPDKVQAEVANRIPSGILATGTGANAEDQAYYVYAAQQRAAGLPVDDIVTWKEQHKQAATEAEDAHKIALNSGVEDPANQHGSARRYARRQSRIFKSIMSSTSKQQAASQIFNWDGKGQDPAILYGNGKALSTEETTAVQNARQLHLTNYASNFKDATPGQRLSQQEAKRLGDAADQLGNFSGTVDDYMGRINDVKNRIAHAMGNAHGEARDLNSLPIQYRAKIDPSFLEGPNALKNLPSWAIPKPVNSEADIAALTDGQAYRPGPGFGRYSGKILFKGQEAGYEDY